MREKLPDFVFDERFGVRRVDRLSLLDENGYYRHGNATVLPRYFENSRNELQEKLGIGDDKLAREGKGFFITHLDVDYCAQVRFGEQFDVISVLRRPHKGAIFYFDYQIAQNKDVCVRAATEHCFVHLGKSGVAIRPPKDFLERIG